MTNIAFCITVFHKRKVHQNAAPFPLAHFVQMTMSRHTTVTVLLLIKTAAAASALRGRGSHVFLFFTQWQCAQLRWHHATFAYLISTVQLGCTPPHEKFLCPTQGRSKGGAHSDIKNKQAKENKKKKKSTVPSCDLVPIVHVNEPFNRISSFVNVTTLPGSCCFNKLWLENDNYKLWLR